MAEPAVLPDPVPDPNVPLTSDWASMPITSAGDNGNDINTGLNGGTDSWMAEGESMTAYRQIMGTPFGSSNGMTVFPQDFPMPGDSQSPDDMLNTGTIHVVNF